MERHTRKINKQRVRRKRIFWFVIFPILLFAGTGLSYGTYLYKKAAMTMDASYKEIEGRENGSNLRDDKVNPQMDNVSILFIGIDDSEGRSFGENSRSDALMLATLNEKAKTVKLVSIPRDSYVYIDKVGYKTRINHAHAYGGPKATIETVEELLDIPVDYYVRMDFQAFMEVVDALGGVEVDVPFAISEQDSKDRAGAINLKKGLQTLDGEQALAFARTRHIDNDIERGKRQQEIMKSVMKKATKVQSVLKYGKVIDAVGSNMKTNMTFDEMKSLVDYGVSGNLSVETFTLKGTDSTGGPYYWHLDEQALEELKLELKNHLEVAKRDKDVASGQ